MNMPGSVYEMEILLGAALAGRVVAQSNDELASLAHLISKGLMNHDSGFAYLTAEGIDAANRLRTGS
jgi:hypothetical protein